MGCMIALSCERGDPGTGLAQAGVHLRSLRCPVVDSPERWCGRVAGTEWPGCRCGGGGRQRRAATGSACPSGRQAVGGCTRTGGGGPGSVLRQSHRWPLRLSLSQAPQERKGDLCDRGLPPAPCRCNSSLQGAHEQEGDIAPAMRARLALIGVLKVPNDTFKKN